MVKLSQKSTRAHGPQETVDKNDRNICLYAYTESIAEYARARHDD